MALTMTNTLKTILHIIRRLNYNTGLYQNDVPRLKPSVGFAALVADVPPKPPNPVAAEVVAVEGSAREKPDDWVVVVAAPAPKLNPPVPEPSVGTVAAVVFGADRENPPVVVVPVVPKLKPLKKDELTA